MNLPKIVSHDEWLVARKRLLAKEKDFTRARDRLNAERRRLPMVRIDKEYVFDGPDGKATLFDLFDGRRQLIVYHFMFDPAWDAGCEGCSIVVDNIGHLAHLHARDTSLVLVSRAPLPKLLAYQKRMGWTVRWCSSYGSEFNYDFHVTGDESVAPVEYNYRDQAELLAMGDDGTGEGHGLSAFLRGEADVFHTYSTYARGTDLLNSTFNYLDLTALGRQEPWEEPPGRSWLPASGWWWRRHDDTSKRSTTRGIDALGDVSFDAVRRTPCSQSHGQALVRSPAPGSSNSRERTTASSGPTGKPSSTRSTNTPVRRDEAGREAVTQRHR
jgi:predicted dithiol-disulfide oxidoreductase (DUF899 family)